MIIQKKLKGISKAAVKNITYEEYEDCLLNGTRSEHTNYSIRSVKHDIYLQQVNKNSLNSMDDKRCYHNAIESEPWS